MIQQKLSWYYHYSHQTFQKKVTDCFFSKISMQFPWISVGLNFSGSSLDDILNFDRKEIYNRKFQPFNFWLCNRFLIPKRHSENVELLLVLAESLAKKRFKFYLLSGVAAFNSSCAILPQQTNACVLPIIHNFLLTENYHPQQSVFTEKKNWIWSKQEWPNRNPRLHQFIIQVSGTFVYCRGAYNHVSSHHFMNMPLSIQLFAQERN